MILTARALLLDARTWIEGGGLLLEGGVVRRCLSSTRAVQRAAAGHRRLDLGDVVLTPGLVNAHAHLELGALAGRTGRRGGFHGWVRDVVRGRATLVRSDLERAVRSGARALLASGTTAVGDIDASGACARLAAGLGLRVRVYTEVLDAWDPRRTDLARLRMRRRARRSARVRAGISPHAPYTTSTALLQAVRRASGPARLALAVHWAETREEREWLEHGRGGLADLLGISPRRSGLELLEDAGLLTPRTSLVHGNDARPDELARLARRGITLVHCPGTHAFFARPRFPLLRVARAGIPLALGTDSLASNDALDMRHEMRRLSEATPGVAPEAIFRMATEGGARALVWPRIGHLRPGAAADAVAWRVQGRTRAAVLEELTRGVPPVARTFVASRFRAG